MDKAWIKPYTISDTLDFHTPLVGQDGWTEEYEQTDGQRIAIS